MSFKQQADRVLELSKGIAWRPSQAELTLFADTMLQRLTSIRPTDQGSMYVGVQPDKTGLFLALDPHWTATLSDAHLRAVIVHETQHVLMSDLDRMRPYLEPRDWYNGWPGMRLFNMARDCQINDRLARLGIKVPPVGVCGPNTFGRAVEEEALEDLMRELAQKQPPPAEQQAGAGTDLQEAQEGAGEAQETGQAEGMEVRIGRSPTGVGKTAMDVSGSERAAWERFLAECMDTRKTRESWYRVSKRLAGISEYAERQYALPYREPLPRKRALIAIDVSGSMSVSAVRLLGSLVRNSPANYDLQVICFDTQAREWTSFRTGTQVPATGGGTDFSTVERFAAGLTRYPDAILVLTDGDAPCPQVKKPAVWSWLIYGDNAAKHLTVGRVVELEKVVRR